MLIYSFLHSRVQYCGKTLNVNTQYDNSNAFSAHEKFKQNIKTDKLK